MTTAADVRDLTENALKKQFYIALQYPNASEEAMLGLVRDHLSYMSEHEDKVFLSGPLLKAGVSIDAGLTILKTEDEAEARAIMDSEPLIKAGLRQYELKLWRILEGSMTVGISGAKGTATIG